MQIPIMCCRGCGDGPSPVGPILAGYGQPDATSELLVTVPDIPACFVGLSALAIDEIGARGPAS